MKKIVIPDCLLNLPTPWCFTSSIKLSEEIENLEPVTKEIEKALSVLDLCLQDLPKLTSPKWQHLPEDLELYWTFVVESIARKIPTLDEFDYSLMEEQLKKNQIEPLSEEMIEEAAETWIVGIAKDITKDTIRWLEKPLKFNKDPKYISDFLSIVNRHWQQVDEDLASFLISESATIARENAFPLLDLVEQESSSESLKETATTYRRLILDSNK